VLGFALVAFFAVCGGPFGLEAQVISGGPLLSLISYAVLPFLWALPQVAMTAELASRFPEDGGFVVWVATAFGEPAALVAGVNGVVASTVELAIYPTLVAEYMAEGSAFIDHGLGPAVVASIKVSPPTVRDFSAREGRGRGLARVAARGSRCAGVRVRASLPSSPRPPPFPLAAARRSPWSAWR